MHIVLATLGAIVTVVILLKRLADAGISLGGLNPFAVRGARGANSTGPPAYRLRTPLEAAGVLLVATLRADGKMTAQGEALLLTLFRDELGLADAQATRLLRRSQFVVGNGAALRNDLDAVLDPVITKFTHEQAESLLGMMEQVAQQAGDPHPSALELVASTRARFAAHAARQGSRPQG